MTQHHIEFERVDSIEVVRMDVECYEFLARVIRFFAAPNSRQVTVYTDNAEYRLIKTDSEEYGDSTYSLISTLYTSEQGNDGHWTTHPQTRAYETPDPMRMLSQFLQTFC